MVISKCLDAIKLDISGAPNSRKYIPMQNESEAERNAQLDIQKEEFIRIVSFKIMQYVHPILFF